MCRKLAIASALIAILGAGGLAAVPDTRDLQKPRTTLSAPMSLPAVPVQGCCKRCSKGKACGDSCIARDKTCHKGPGCACDT